MKGEGRVNIDQLKTFVAVVETDSFTRAAGTVHLTQSAVSLQIKRLEEELGVSLLTRFKKSFEITGAGNDLLQHARKIIELHDEAVLAVSNRSLAGHIRIGAPEDYISPFLTRILSRFSRSHPRVKVDVMAEVLRERTVFLVTHDPLEALRLGHDVRVMSGAPARLDEPLAPPGIPPRDPGDPDIMHLQAELLSRLSRAQAAGKPDSAGS